MNANNIFLAAVMHELRTTHANPTEIGRYENDENDEFETSVDFDVCIAVTELFTCGIQTYIVSIFFCLKITE